MRTAVLAVVSCKNAHSIPPSQPPPKREAYSSTPWITDGFVISFEDQNVAEAAL